MKTSPALIVVLVVASSALAGCSAGALPGTPGGSSAGATGAGGTAGTTTAPATGTSGAINLCSVLPLAAASAAAGKSFAAAKEDDLQKGVYECDYGTDTYNWSVAVYEAPDTENLSSLELDLGGSSLAKPVSGIGDRAFVSPVGVAAQFGNRFIEVGTAGNSSANEPGYEALAKAAIAALK
jgi:hypothetical protein